MSTPKLSSKIWNFFTINAEDESKANCDVCNKRLTRGGRNARSYGTSALINHLRSFHHSEYDEYTRSTESHKRKRDDEEDSKRKHSKQGNLDYFIEKMTPFGQNDPRKHAITKSIGEMIAVDMQPFCLVEDIGFTRLMKVLEPRYKLPSAMHFSRTIIPDMYLSVKAIIQERVDKALYVCFTSDAWTSDNNLHAFLSLTAHWIDSNWERQYAFLQLRLLEVSHTGEMLAAELLSIMEEWKVVRDRRGILVRDNGSNMVKAARVAKISDLGCYIHTLQLVVGESLKTQKAVRDAIAIARGIVSHFRHSSKATAHLKRIQESLNSNRTDDVLDVTDQVHPAHRLIQDVPTRWNSTYYMLERLLEQKRAIGVYSQEADIKSLTANQWSLVDKVLNTLKPFEEQTKQASLASSHAGMIIPGVRLLERYLQRTKNPGDDAGIQTMRTEIYTDLHARFQHLMTNKTCVVATVLDATYKLRFFDSNEKANARQILLEVALKEIRTRRSKTARVTSATQCNSEQSDFDVVAADSDMKHGASSVLDDYWEDFDDQQQEHTAGFDSTTDEAICLKELDAYLAEPIQPRVTPPLDPIEYWKLNQRKYPILADCAQSFLATPASSVESERSFSSASDICKDKRSSLAPHKLEQLLFLKKNLSVVNFNY
ncbi:hypothetical protein ACJMK2_019310 [Sinanodonta woodiana]|uniref:BED-type domain-containing protein n=2 Tax=Sinanodonta woodiana TaxID=1069815 RepID=A0ABD3UIT7_SINWO